MWFCSVCMLCYSLSAGQWNSQIQQFMSNVWDTSNVITPPYKKKEVIIWYFLFFLCVLAYFLFLFNISNGWVNFYQKNNDWAHFTGEEVPPSTFAMTSNVEEWDRFRNIDMDKEVIFASFIFRHYLWNFWQVKRAIQCMTIDVSLEHGENIFSVRIANCLVGMWICILIMPACNVVTTDRHLTVGFICFGRLL